MGGVDCPTGTCGAAVADPDCRSVKRGDTINPQSKAHIERNSCNRCPKSPPRPVYITKPGKLWGTTRVLSHYTDDEGNRWAPDNAVTAWWYHNDPFPGLRDNNNMTFRVVATGNGSRGWQCRYSGGALDDTTTAMGTFDYAPAGTGDHISMDVTPHGANPHYKAGLTATY
jgi:hypothetical protein